MWMEVEAQLFTSHGVSYLVHRQDYKVNPAGAAPYATVSLYDDLIVGKGLGLVRADITPNLTKKVLHFTWIEKLK